MMDSYAKQVHDYLMIMKESALLVSDLDRANMDILITMLGEVDRNIINTHYGLFGTPQQPLEAIASKHSVSPEVILDIIEKDLRKIAITPEWQVMKQGFSATVKAKLENS